MTKLVYEKLKTSKVRPSASVRRKRVKAADGKTVEILSLDAESPTFTDDLTYLFRRNVARARRENMRLFGSPRGDPAKA